MKYSVFESKAKNIGYSGKIYQTGYTFDEWDLQTSVIVPKIATGPGHLTKKGYLAWKLTGEEETY